MQTRGETIPDVQEEATGALGPDVLETEELDDYNPKETAAQTAERILKGDTPDDKIGDEGTNFKETQTDVETKGEVKQVRGKGKQEEYDPELSPPERLDAASKQMFNNLPKGLKRAYHKAIKDLESGSSKERETVIAQRQEIQSIKDAALPFAGEWAEKGRTIPQAIAELGAFQRKLASPDIAVREKTYLQLARQAKVDLVKLANQAMGRESESSTSNNLPDIAAHPLVAELKNEIAHLREQIQPVQSMYQQQQQLQIDAETDTIVSEVETVRNEKDPASGQYRYPELFDEAFLGRMIPLVSDLRRNVPTLSWGAAYREAHRIMTGRGNPALPNQTRPQQSNNNTNIAQRAAAVSVRGGSTPSIGIQESGPPAELKSISDQLRWFTQNGRG